MLITFSDVKRKEIVTYKMPMNVNVFIRACNGFAKACKPLKVHFFVFFCMPIVDSSIAKFTTPDNAEKSALDSEGGNPSGI